MEDNYNILIDYEFKSKIQSILNGFSESIDLILFKYDVMNLIKHKITEADGDSLIFEKNIDKECRLKHNETEIFDAQYVIDLIRLAEIPAIFFVNFINEIEDKAKTKKSYSKIDNNNVKSKLVI